MFTAWTKTKQQLEKNKSSKTAFVLLLSALFAYRWLTDFSRWLTWL